MKERNCLNCNSRPDDRPQIYKGEDYCSDGCRRALGIKKEMDLNHGATRP